MAMQSVDFGEGPRDSRCMHSYSGWNLGRTPRKHTCRGASIPEAETNPGGSCRAAPR